MKIDKAKNAVSGSYEYQSIAFMNDQSHCWQHYQIGLLGIFCLFIAACAQLPASPETATAQNVPGLQTERGLIITMEAIFFDFDSAELNAAARKKIASLAQLLKQENNNYIIGIDGYTDIIGQEDYNLNLSKLRADSVKAAFIAAGITPERLDSKGFGQSDPIADNSTLSGRQQNRRVEILILQPSEIQRKDDF